MGRRGSKEVRFIVGRYVVAAARWVKGEDVGVKFQRVKGRGNERFQSQARSQPTAVETNTREVVDRRRGRKRESLSVVVMVE
jgi:hypothetical protein